MSTPTRTQVDTALGRVVELCQPGHLEGHGRGAWEAHLALAAHRADQFAGVLRSTMGGGGCNGDPSDPTGTLATTVDPWRDIDTRLTAATTGHMQACSLVLTGTVPNIPTRRPASVAMVTRAVLDRADHIPAAFLTGPVSTAHTLTGLILAICHTDRTKTGRQSTATECLVCSRPVACTTRDPIRGGWCSACNMAYRRARLTDPGLDRVLFGRRRRAQLTAPTPVVHVDPTDTIPAPLPVAQ